MVPSIFRSYSRPPLTADPNLSPTLTATTSADFDLDLDGNRVPIITRADLRNSVAAYENLLSTAKVYRTQLQNCSIASTAFAGALEECARVKGAGSGVSGEQLLAASGVQYMIANSNQVLSDTLYRHIEVPLLHSYDTYISGMATRHSDYEALLQVKTAAIKHTESENFKQGRKKSRDLNQFRRALEKLQEQVKEVEVCKGSYYAEVYEVESENWEMISGKVALLLRSTLDLADRLASKATSDPVIEGMLNEHPDPFDSYRLESEEERDVFSILPPLGMNLGLGATKKASLIDNSKDDITSTPRQQRTQVPQRVTSVADALGLNNNNNNINNTDSRSSYHSSDANTIQDIPDHIPPFSYPASSSSSPSPSPPLTTSSIENLDHHLQESSSTTPTHHNDVFASSSSRNSNGKSRNNNNGNTNSINSDLTSPSRHSNNRRQLSRIVDNEEPTPDPMSGDWNVYTSPNHNENGRNSYYSSEEERS